MAQHTFCNETSLAGEFCSISVIFYCLTCRPSVSKGDSILYFKETFSKHYPIYVNANSFALICISQFEPTFPQAPDSLPLDSPGMKHIEYHFLIPNVVFSQRLYYFISLICLLIGNCRSCCTADYVR